MLTEPTNEDLRDLKAKEDWVAGHYPEESRAQYDGLGAKLLLIQQILDEGWIDKNDPQYTLKLQCLGASFGAALIQYYDGLSWKVADDDFGLDARLSYQGTSIQLFPLTMISKRVEDGEDVNVKSLFVETCKSLDRVREDTT